MKKFFISPWLLLFAAAAVSAALGAFNGTTIVLFGLIALALLGRPRHKERKAHSSDTRMATNNWMSTFSARNEVTE
jgi:hypothetical protein